MTQRTSIGSTAPQEVDDLLAVHNLLVLTQTEIQKLLNEKGLKYRDLARRLGVTEARVSQIFSENATNLTIKTIAKIFLRLNEEAYITSAREFARVGCAGTKVVTVDTWEAQELGDHYVVLNTHLNPVESRIPQVSSRMPIAQAKRWAEADHLPNRVA
jgi:transcriptional regulator with XRE-family HTH domain